MKILAFIFLLFSLPLQGAEEIILERGGTYTVSEGKTWSIENTLPLECKVCTADVYVSGELSNVKIAGVVFHGEFNFSISNKKHGAVVFYPGTIISLGDSRGMLRIIESAEQH